MGGRAATVAQANRRRADHDAGTGQPARPVQSRERHQQEERHLLHQQSGDQGHARDLNVVIRVAQPVPAATSAHQPPLGAIRKPARRHRGGDRQHRQDQPASRMAPPPRGTTPRCIMTIRSKPTHGHREAQTRPMPASPEGTRRQSPRWRQGRKNKLGNVVREPARQGRSPRQA